MSDAPEAAVEPEAPAQGDPGDEQPVGAETSLVAEETKAAAGVPAPSGFAVFEAHAANWFATLEEAEAHAYELVSHCGDQGGVPVIAKPVGDGS